MIEKEMDGDWFVRLWLDDGCAHVACYEVLEIIVRGDRPEFRRKGASPNGRDTTDDPADAHVQIHGNIKWDGCSHNIFVGDGDGYFYAERASLVALAGVFAWLYDQAAEMMRAAGQHVERMGP